MGGKDNKSDAGGWCTLKGGRFSAGDDENIKCTKMIAGAKGILMVNST